MIVNEISLVIQNRIPKNRNINRITQDKYKRKEEFENKNRRRED